MSLSKKDYESVMDFIYSLNPNIPNFPQHVTDLISKFFSCKAVNFTSININIDNINNIDNLENKDSMYFMDSISSQNKHINVIEEYKECYYKTSFFQLANLPKHLRFNPIVQVSDIMPFKQYEKTEICHFLKKHDFYYDVILQLYYKDMLLGRISILNPKMAGNFKNRDIEILKIFNKHISQNLKIYNDLSICSYQQQIIKDFYDKLPVGIISLDSKLSVIESNNMAKELCREISEIHNFNDINTSKNLLNLSQSNQYISNIINLISNQLKNNNTNKGINIKSNKNVYSIKTSSFLMPNQVGSLETTYFIYIVKRLINKSASSNNPSICFNLTKRELEVVNLIQKGFSNKQISDTLYISDHTVKTHILNIFKKVDVTSRTSLLNKLNTTY